MERRVLLAATFAPQPFTDPFPAPGTQGQSVVAPAWTQSFEDAAVFGSSNLSAAVVGKGWNGYASGAYPSFTTPAALQGAKTAMTIEFWAKGGATGHLITGPGFNVTGQGNLGPNGSNIFQFQMGINGVYAGSVGINIGLPVSADNNTWHHYVVTNDLQYLSAYRDGELYERHWIGNSYTQIGPMTDGTNTVLQPNLQLGSSCAVDELRLYNTALTPVQVRQNFENYRAYSTVRYVSPSGGGTATGLDTNNPMSLVNALALAGANTKLILKGGYQYDGSQFQLTNKGGTEADRDFLIMGEPGTGSALIKVTSGSTGPTISGGGFITLRNLDFNNASASTANALTISSVTNPIVIDGCTISSDTAGLLVNSSTKVTVQNTAVRAATTGMSFVSSPNAIVRNNTIYSGTVGASFTSTSNYLAMVGNIIAGQSSKCVSIDHSSAGHLNGSTFTGDAIADNNAYSVSVPFATLNGTDYTTSQLYNYQLAWYNLYSPGASQLDWGRSPELHSFINSPTFNSTSTSALDLGLRPVAGNPIDSNNFSTLSDPFVPAKIEPALFDSTGAVRPLPNPLTGAPTASGGAAADLGAYETAAPIQYQFTLAQASVTSAGAYKPDGTLIRTLWSGRKLPAGSNVAYWNGLDDNSQPVTAGAYKIKVVANNVVYSWDGVVGNKSDYQSGPTTERDCFSLPGAMAVTPDGTTAYIAQGYQEGQKPIWRLSTSAIRQVQTTLGFAAGTNSKVITDVATDGTRAYFVSCLGEKSSSPAHAGFVSAWNVSDNTQVTSGNWGQIDGGTYGDWHGIVVGTTPYDGNYTHPAITGIAVQTSGSLLFVSLPYENKICLYDKTTGAKQSTEISVTSPGRLAITPSGDLWVISGTSILKFSSSNNWESAVTTISGLANPVALAYTSYTYGQGTTTGSLLVTDSGSSQQVKAFRNDTGASIWTYGQAGGYGNGVNVTNDKFEFGNYDVNYQLYWSRSFVTALSDGSFWVYDYATYRTMKFDASRVYQNAGTMEYENNPYCASVDANNPTRAFSGWLEFQVDYSKAMGPDTGAWTPVRFWGHNLPTSNYGFSEGLQQVATLSNGHTYAYSRALGQFVELTNTGVRATGIGANDRHTGCNWHLQPDGTLELSAPTSPTSTLYIRALTGFDSSNNPIWAAATTAATVPYTSNALGYSDAVGTDWRTDSTSGLDVTHQADRQPGYHLGAVTNGGSQWLWQALPTGRLDGHGTWDSNAQQVGSELITGMLGRSVMVCYRGEFWDSLEANQFMQYYDNGLFIGQFGIAGWGTDQYGSPLPGLSTNMLSTIMVQVGNTAYIYANDESGHGGVGRYSISGLDTIVELTGEVSTSGPAAPTGLTALAVSASQINLTWTDNSTNETGFRLERATDSGFTQNLALVTTTGANVTNYSDSGLAAGTTYYYRVRATNAGGDSSNVTASATTQTLSGVPAAPSGLVATAVSPAQINLTWTDGSSNETGFKVERAADSDFTVSVTLLTTTAADVTSHSDIGLAANTTYYYRVRATNAVGDSANSSTASATTSSSGATVTYAGYEIATAGSGTWQQGNRVDFRTTGTGYTKAFDPDGNNVYGSDGYIVYAAGSTMTSGTFANNGLQVSNPTSYISSVNVSAGAGTVSSVGSGFGNLDNPTLPPGPGVADVSVGTLMKVFDTGYGTNAISDFLEIGVSSAKTFTIGLETLNGDRQKPLAWILGGVTASRAQVQTSYLQYYGNPDWYFFTVTTNGPQTITLQIQRDGTAPQAGINAITFDSPLTTPPSAPSNMTAAVVSQTQINLMWTDNSSNETGFKIERATDSGFTQNLTLVTTTAANVTSYSSTGLAANTTYYYRVRATNEGVDSANSNTAGPVMPLLQVNGDQGSAGQSDQVRVARNAANSSLLDVFINSITPTYSVNFAALNTLAINGLGGDDTLTLDLANGPVIPAGGISYDGGTQTSGDSLIITGASSNQAVTFSSNQVAIGTGVVTLTSVENRSFNGVQRLSSLTLSGGSTLSLPEGGQTTLVVQSLSVDATSSLDLADNAVIVDYSGSNPFAGIYSLVASSAANHWAGNGIVSHTAAGGGSQYAIGVADNGVANLASFAGQTVDATSVLIRFTYSGDPNLDGQVDLTDLSILAGSWQIAGRQWGQGDVDYSGLVDLTDLVLLASNWQKVLPTPAAAEMFNLTTEVPLVSQPIDDGLVPGDAVVAPVVDSTSAEAVPVQTASPVTVSPALAAESETTVTTSAGHAPMAPPAAAATVRLARAVETPARAVSARPAGVSQMAAPSRSRGVFSDRPLPVVSTLATWPSTGQGRRLLLGNDRLGLGFSGDILVRDGYSPRG